MRRSHTSKKEIEKPTRRYHSARKEIEFLISREGPLGKEDVHLRKGNLLSGNEINCFEKRFEKWMNE